MGKKKVKLLTLGQSIETVVEVLTDLDYVYLDNSEFKPGWSIEQTMRKKHYKCYHLRSHRKNSKTVEEIDIWCPEGKIYCELVFSSEGLSDLSCTTIGKNKYNNAKALGLAEKNIILNKSHSN